MNFVAIDFETANSNRTSACSMGLAYVENGVIVNTEHFLIRPEPFRFDSINVSIHGITEKDVMLAPDFLSVWKSVLPTIRGLPLVAHNAAFDMSVIRYCLDYYGREYPSSDYICTLRLAQIVEPNVGCYRLDYLCLKHNISIAHHNAASDAQACADLLLDLCGLAGVSSISELKKKKLLQFGSIYPEGYTSCTGSKVVCSKKPKQNLNGLDIIYLDEDFAGKYFVFTGTLSCMPREAAVRLVAQAGGIPQAGVTSQTNYLVTGMQSSVALRGKKMSGKLEKAIRLAEAGQDIQIIQEDDFLKMIDTELWEKFLQTM